MLSMVRITHAHNVSFLVSLVAFCNTCTQSDLPSCQYHSFGTTSRLADSICLVCSNTAICLDHILEEDEVRLHYEWVRQFRL